MENKQKIEEKYKYFFNNNSNNFAIDICKFENILKNYSDFSNETPAKNGYKLYGINNKFFKIFQDGSCYGYTIIDSQLKEMNDMVEYKQTNQQIYNDDFAGLKNYWVEEIYEEIIFKLEDDIQIIFTKMHDVHRNISQYSIFIDIKNKKNTIQQIQKKYKEHFEILTSS